MDDKANQPRRDERRWADDNGLNDRPRNDTISQSGPGLPDDSSKPVDISDEEERRMEDKLKKL